ncbi:MAG: hypothetical protein A2583_03280 [Bdellovibrionales bacterium RIFOXYD1_FULL_53_11]|nr:MAG: hypothetical protein A2583_03280 [Bdellovibrionales bacterium RIFOXYD1_FULL_53_11]
MFLDNKYTYWYWKIIKAVQKQSRRNKEGFHCHHILPKSLGGTNKLANRILLTPREHYICHLLLTRMTTGIARSKMVYAFFRFSPRTNPQTSRSYARLQEFYSKAVSGTGNVFFGKKHTTYTRNLISRNHGMRGKNCFEVWKETYGIVEAEQRRDKMLQKRSVSMKGAKNPMFGVPRTETQKLNQAIKMTGARNPRYGKSFYWIHRNGHTKSIEQQLLSKFLQDGWARGRGGSGGRKIRFPANERHRLRLKTDKPGPSRCNEAS